MSKRIDLDGYQVFVANKSIRIMKEFNNNYILAWFLSFPRRQKTKKWRPYKLREYNPLNECQTFYFSTIESVNKKLLKNGIKLPQEALDKMRSVLLMDRMADLL